MLLIWYFLYIFLDCVLANSWFYDESIICLILLRSQFSSTNWKWSCDFDLPAYLLDYISQFMGMNLDERGGGVELGRVETWETIVRIYYVRKKCIFNKRKRKTFRIWLRKNRFKALFFSLYPVTSGLNDTSLQGARNSQTLIYQCLDVIPCLQG